MDLKTTVNTVLSLFIASFLGVFAYQAMGGFILDGSDLTISVFPFAVRCIIIGLFAGLTRRKDSNPYLAAALALFITVIGALITYYMSPIGHNVYNYQLGLHLAFEPLIAISIALGCWYLSRFITYKALVITLAALSVIAVSVSYIPVAKFYTVPNSVAYLLSHTRTRLSDLGYDGFDYAETINRMNLKGDSYYKAYKDSWAGDERVQPFDSIMFFRPSGMPTILALLPGKTLFSVFLWWGVLLGLSTLATYSIILKYADSSYAFISSVLVGITFVTIFAALPNAFNWLFGEGLAAMVLIWAIAFTVYKKWWPAAICFVLACATREFSIMLLPVPFIALLLEEKGTRKKGLIALITMLFGVFGFYLFHYYAAPVADAQTGTKFNHISTWFRGSFDYYKNYLTYNVKNTWALTNFMTLLPPAGIASVFAIKSRKEMIPLIYIPITLGLFYFFMGQNKYQDYWGGFGIPLLMVCLALCSAFDYVKDEDPNGSSSKHNA